MGSAKGSPTDAGVHRRATTVGTETTAAVGASLTGDDTKVEICRDTDAGVAGADELMTDPKGFIGAARHGVTFPSDWCCRLGGLHALTGAWLLGNAQELGAWICACELPTQGDQLANSDRKEV